MLFELDRIAEEMGTDYSLAYRPPERGRPDEHSMDVRVRDESLEVRHRRSSMEKNVERRNERS